MTGTVERACTVIPSLSISAIRAYNMTCRSNIKNALRTIKPLLPLGSSSSPPPCGRSFHPRPRWKTPWFWFWRWGSRWWLASPSSYWLFLALGSLHRCGQDWPSPHIHTCNQTINVTILKLSKTFLWGRASSWEGCGCGCPTFSLPYFLLLSDVEGGEICWLL